MRLLTTLTETHMVEISIREDIPSKILENLNFKIGLEAMFIENNIRKSK